MLKKLDEQNRPNWVTDVKNLLFRYGFGFVWIVQEVGDKDSFLHEFRQRLIDCSIQEWSEKVHESEKLECYREFKTLLNTEKYLSVVNPRYRQCLAAIRCSSHPLQIEVGRRLNIPRQERYCTFCITKGLKKVEDEYHFVMICSLYDDIRKSAGCNLFNVITQKAFVELMKTKNEQSLHALGKFIYKSLQAREMFIKSLLK